VRLPRFPSLTRHALRKISAPHNESRLYTKIPVNVANSQAVPVTASNSQIPISDLQAKVQVLRLNYRKGQGLSLQTCLRRMQRLHTGRHSLHRSSRSIHPSDNLGSTVSRKASAPWLTTRRRADAANGLRGVLHEIGPLRQSAVASAKDMGGPVCAPQSSLKAERRSFRACLGP